VQVGLLRVACCGMTKCCGCNVRSGTCGGCKCAKAGTACLMCAPGGAGRCTNGGNRVQSDLVASVGRDGASCGGNNVQPALAAGDGGAGCGGPFQSIWGDVRPAWVSKKKFTTPLTSSAVSVSTGSQLADLSSSRASGSIQSPNDIIDASGAVLSAALPAAPPMSTAPSGPPGSAAVPTASLVGVSLASSSAASPTPAPLRGVASSPPSYHAGKGFWSLSEWKLTLLMDDAYREVVTWRRNIFLLPFGGEGKAFVAEVARLINTFAQNLPGRQYAWSAVVVFGQLLLQKPFSESTVHNHKEALKRRMSLWEEGDLNALLSEAGCIQDHLPKYSDGGSDGEHVLDGGKLAKMVFENKIGTASRYLDANGSGGVLRLDQEMGGGGTVLDALKDKHPDPRPRTPGALVEGEFTPPDPILYEAITPALVRRVTLRMSGSAGPSGLDSLVWKRMVSVYKEASDALCSSLSLAAKCLCVEDLDPGPLEALLAGRLIPLDKQPGVRPIAVGEVPRRIIGKAIMSVIEKDVVRVTTPLQLCVGVPSACEVAVAALRSFFGSDDADAVLLVDASNAFNSMNRDVALHNIPRVCPPAGRIFRNTYQAGVNLYVDGGVVLQSREGTCQGDPLSMAFYALAMMPLAWSLSRSCPEAPQQWYADDDAATGKVEAVRRYWAELEEDGPIFGYFPNAAKTILLVKPECEAEARRRFEGTGICIRTDGVRYLGGCIGTDQFTGTYVNQRVSDWSDLVLRLAKVAETQPHAAYTIMVRALQSRWTYLQRIQQIDAKEFQALDAAITDHLLPAIMGHQCPPGTALSKLVSLPVRDGGLGLPLPSSGAADLFRTSNAIIKPMVDRIYGSAAANPVSPAGPASPTVDGSVSYGDSGGTSIASESGPDVALGISHAGVAHAIVASRLLAREESQDRRKAAHQLAEELRPQLSPPQQLLVETAGEKGVSSWLTEPPTFESRTVLQKQDFRDAMCLRYGLPIRDLPTSCVCGKDLTVHHAHTCNAGGYLNARHDEVRDIVAEALRDVCRDVEIEPVLMSLSGERLHGKSAKREDDARVDIRALGFWTRQQNAFFDVRVTHPKAHLLSCSEVESQLATHEDVKKGHYRQRVTDVERGSFTPLVFATTGQASRECDIFLKTLVTRLAERHHDLPYSVLMRRLRARLSFALLRWRITCLRGSRSSYRRSHISFVADCRRFARR